MNSIHVVAAIIIRDNRVLIARRSPHKSSAGLWEFPGGKVESPESPECALKREIQEELGVDLIVDGQYLRQTTEEFDRLIDLDAYRCNMISENVGRSPDHDKIRWVDIVDLRYFTFCAPDLPAVKKLIQDGR